MKIFELHQQIKEVLYREIGEVYDHPDYENAVSAAVFHFRRHIIERVLNYWATHPLREEKFRFVIQGDPFHRLWYSQEETPEWSITVTRDGDEFDLTVEASPDFVRPRLSSRTEDAITIWRYDDKVVFVGTLPALSQPSTYPHLRAFTII